MGAQVGDLVLDVLAVSRLTRLVTTDRVSEPLRDRVAARPELGMVSDGLECDWCVSVWWAFGVGVVRRFRWWRLVRRGLVVALLAGWLSVLEDRVSAE